MKSQQQDSDSDGPYQAGAVYVGGLQTKYLSASDMVLPLMCGVCIHLVYIGLLIPITFLFYNNYDNLESCMNVHVDILLSLLLGGHTFILITDLLCCYHSLRSKAGGTNKCLNGLLTLRLILNVAEILLVLYGFYAVFIEETNANCWKSNIAIGDTFYILIAFFLSFNLAMLVITWCCLWFCLSSKSSSATDSDHSNSCLPKLCSACIYDENASQVITSFYGMGGLINILSEGTRYTPAEIITGLHLLRMLQKHYGLLQENYDLSPSHYKPLNDKQLLTEYEYFTLYANAAYGIPLFSMSSPFAICCAPPCCLPSNFDDKYSDQSILETDKLVLREKKCCHPIQVDNSSFKVFIQRTNCQHPQNNILLVSQIGGLHSVNFYVVVDHHKRCLVIAIRGTLSLGDTITDANTEPELCSYIETDHKCYVHKGIGQCAKHTFDKIMKSKAIIEFVKNNQYKNYDITITGHSLGAGTTVLLSLMMKYGVSENLKYFINKNRKFKAYAIAPPSCVDIEFAMAKQDEISEFLTCVIYGHDMIPRLSFKGLISTRAAISLLLNQLNKTDNGPWFVYRKSITMNNNTILEMLPTDSIYCNNVTSMPNIEMDANDDVIIDEEKNESLEILLPKSSGESCFMHDIEKEVEFMKEIYDNKLEKDWSDKYPENEYKESDLCKNNELLWNVKFCQIGKVIFIAKENENDDDIGKNGKNGNECCQCMGKMCHVICTSIIGNVCRCRCCLDPKDTKYKAYIANIDLFCDRILFSANMMPDHMPHLYLDVLQRLTN